MVAKRGYAGGTTKINVNYGPDCHYEHRCSYCLAKNHTALNCYKKQNDGKKKSKGGSTSADKD